jgi:hypothetical protein
MAGSIDQRFSEISDPNFCELDIGEVIEGIVEGVAIKVPILPEKRKYFQVYFFPLHGG